MEEGFGRATRTTVFVAVFLAFVMLAPPSLDTSNGNTDLGVTDNAAAAAGDRTVTLGIVDLKGAVATLNPLKYTMAEEMMVIWPCYSYLLQYDTDGATRIGDLARKWSMSPNGLFWNFTITPNAYFYDTYRAANSLPQIQLTSRDIIWSYNMIQNATKNYLHSYFPKVNNQLILKNMSWGPTLFDLHIELSSQFAPFANALTSVPVLPKYIWDPKVKDEAPPTCTGWDWDNYDLPTIPPVVGSGPWYYATPGLPQAITIEMKKNPTWFATEERGWELRVDTMVLRSETSEDTNLASFTTGVVDVMMWPSSDQYLKVLTPSNYPDIYKAAISSGFVYEYNLNQMTDAMRSALGGKFRNGDNSQILQDPIVRKAMAMCVDKQAFIDAVRGGLGSPATTIVPASHPFTYVYGSNPARDTQVITFDPDAARALLRSYGWTYDRSGVYVPEWDTETYPLCQYGGANALEFRFYTLSESAEWDKGARLLAQWAEQGGIDLWSGYEIKSTNDMNGLWAAADYDTWLWDWVFTPSSEVSLDILSVLTTDEIGAWQDVYWSNSTFDSLYNQSLVIMDPAARKLVTDELQRINYEYMACQLIAYRADLYAASARGPDNWVNWGDWQGHWILTPDQLGPWCFMTMQPNNQLAPKISTASVPTEWVTGSLMSVSATATDPQGVEYRWFWDDEGNKTGWQSSGVSSHTYTRDGAYDVYLAVRETSGADTFTNWTKFKVIVKDNSNTPPYNCDWSYWPTSNINAGTVVYLNVTSAVDDQGDELYFEWDFGDGHTNVGRNVTHQFMLGEPSSVDLKVDDHRYGSGTRPVVVNKIISVGPNGEPSISVPDRATPPVAPRVDSLMWFLTSDPDAGDPHRYTWNFGDGTPLKVTTTNETTHTYQRQGSYVMQCWADDLTGIPGHNKTDTGNVLVRNGDNTAPTITSWGMSLTNAVRFQTITYWANGTDADHDDVTFTFQFGDNATYVETTEWNKGTPSCTHSYSYAGPKVWQVVISDGFATYTASPPKVINIAIGNREPVITPLVDMKSTVGDERSFTASATDPDGDPVLSYTWQFAWRTNGSGITHYSWKNGQTVTFTWQNQSGIGGYLFRVWVNDNNMSSVVGPANVSDGAYNVVNWIPLIASPPGEITIDALTDQLFEVVAWDNDTLDNTTLLYMWDFGDGTIVTGSNSVTHQYADADVSKDYTVKVWVNDSFLDDEKISHNVTSTATIHVRTLALKLLPGWNLITVPRIMYGYKASTLGLLTGDIVVGWNPATQLYDKTYITNVSLPFKDFAIENSTGYWIYTTTPQTLHLKGTLPTDAQSRTVTVPGAGRWVIIGFNTLNTSLRASHIPAMYSGASVTQVVTFNTTTGLYKTYNPALPFTDYALTPGQGIWIMVTGSGTLTYTP